MAITKDEQEELSAEQFLSTPEVIIDRCRWRSSGDF